MSIEHTFDCQNFNLDISIALDPAYIRILKKGEEAIYIEKPKSCLGFYTSLKHTNFDFDGLYLEVIANSKNYAYYDSRVDNYIVDRIYTSIRILEEVKSSHSEQEMIDIIQKKVYMLEY